MSPERVLNLEKQDELIASACCTVLVSLEKKSGCTVVVVSMCMSKSLTLRGLQQTAARKASGLPPKVTLQPAIN